MEWKYVEEYSRKDLGEGSRGATRRRRYARLYSESPAFNDKAPFEAWLFDPFYQIMRLRLLADRMVRDSGARGDRKRRWSSSCRRTTERIGSV